MGNITQMFHQVWVLPSDCDARRFLWRFKEYLLVGTYQKNVYLFGQTDCPSSLRWALRKTSLDNYEKFNVHIVNAVLNKFYMDDYLNSFDNLDEAITTIHDITRSLTFSGFKKPITWKFVVKGCVNLDLERSPRLLGITWDSNTDILKFQTRSCQKQKGAF